ncbi:MAG: zinc-dependent dehydrogenase [Thermoplasmata archaeon]
MKVAVYHSNRDIRIEERRVPEISSKELLVKVMASGICGSDVMEWYRIQKAPRILGHEIAGVIEEVGDEVNEYDVGDRVFISHHVPCGECRYCERGHTSVCDTLRSTNFYPGGFAEYLKVPEINVEKGTYPIPDEVSYEQGVFIEPLACVIRGQDFADIGKGDEVLVIGSGISGLLHVQLAKAKGAERVTAVDINEFRLKKAEEVGADESFHADHATKRKIKEANDGYLPNKVIVATAAKPAIRSAFELVDRGGRILLFAPTEPEETINLPLWNVWKDEVSIVTSYAAGEKEINEAIELIADGSVKVEPMITHVLPLDEAEKGFKLVDEAKESIKVILKPHE